MPNDTRIPYQVQIISMLTSQKRHINFVRVNADGSLNLHIVCPVCHKLDVIRIASVQGLWEWLTQKKIQDALPELSADQREQLMTGTCNTCWDAMLSLDDEEDEP